jgi:hypothetical protein
MSEQKDTKITQMPNQHNKIEDKIAELEKAASERINALAGNDAQWANIQGQISGLKGALELIKE